jgi:hypothetical protein
LAVSGFDLHILFLTGRHFIRTSEKKLKNC